MRIGRISSAGLNEVRIKQDWLRAHTLPILEPTTSKGDKEMVNRKMKFLLMMSSILTILGVSALAFAQDANAVEVAKANASGWLGLAAGLGIALAAFGGALGQGRAAATALDGIARNPGASDKLFTPMILGLALIESLVIYALIISILLLGKF